jgi:hypothetical protein
VGRLWLTTQQVIAARVAHEIKNTLNGVAVNLEVVRSRLGRVAAAGAVSARTAPAGDTGQTSRAAAALPTSFAETASSEFEQLTREVEALLALVRPVRQPPDVALVVAQLAGLLGLAAERGGGRLSVEGTDDGDARTSVDGETVRLVVAQAMLAALQDGGTTSVRCVVSQVAGEGPRLTMISAGGRDTLALPDDVARVAAAAGVLVDTASPGASPGLILAFPPAPGADA